MQVHVQRVTGQLADAATRGLPTRVLEKSYVSYAAFDDLSRHLCISRWSLPWSYRDWTTVMRHWLVFRPACLTVSSPSSTWQFGRSPVSVARSILQTAPERIKFKLAVLVYRALHGTAPQYLSGQLQYGDRLFAAAGRRLWNSLSVDVQSAPHSQHLVRN